MRVLLFATAVLSASLVAGCGCDEDDAEPNDTQATATDLGVLEDGSDDVVTEDYTLTATDTDFFQFTVLDTGLGGNPTIDVSVTGNGTEDFYVVAAMPCAISCYTGAPDDSLGTGSGCVSPAGRPSVRLGIECDGTSEDGGTATVQVLRQGAATECVDYELTVSVY